jgi:hypothetical protein
MGLETRSTASCLKANAVLAFTLLFAVVCCGAIDVAANATRDAKKLLSCMASFDALCANALTYTKILEEHGISRDRLNEQVTDLYQKLKSIHAAYTRLDLRTPQTPFSVGGRTYIFIPYSFALEARGQRTSSTAFFIGVSENAGGSWLFFDGAKITKENIGMMIPGYAGQPLPPVAFDQGPAH